MRALDALLDHPLELGPRDAHGGARLPDEHRHDGFGVERERLLRLDAFAAQRGQRDASRGVAR